MTFGIEAKICDASIKLAKLTKYPAHGRLAYHNIDFIVFQSLRSIITIRSSFLIAFETHNWFLCKELCKSSSNPRERIYIEINVKM